MEALASAEHNLTEEMMSHADPKEQSNDSDQAEASKENVAQKKEKRKALWDTFDQQVETTFSQKSSEQETKMELTHFYDEVLLPRFKSPFPWWHRMVRFLPQVSTLAKKYLCIPATAVTANRLFFKDRDFVLQKRTNLHTVSPDRETLEILS